MRRGVLAFLLLLGLMLGPLAVGVGADGALQPEAEIHVSIEPALVELTGPGIVSFNVRLLGSLACSPALPGPQPVEVRIIPLERNTLERLQARVEPSEFSVPWESTTRDRFRINETVVVHVHVGVMPNVREHTNFSVLIEATEAADTRPSCDLEGYQIGEQAELVPLIVSPAGEEPELLDGGINWAPLVLAVLLLGVVSLFAIKRDRRRGDGDE